MINTYGVSTPTDDVSLKTFLFNMIIIIHNMSVLPLRKVGGSDLTPRQMQKRLYLCPSSLSSENKAISVSASHGTRYMHEH
jgi:hypothetical protein